MISRVSLIYGIVKRNVWTGMNIKQYTVPSSHFQENAWKRAFFLLLCEQTRSHWSLSTQSHTWRGGKQVTSLHIQIFTVLFLSLNLKGCSDPISRVLNGLPYTIIIPTTLPLYFIYICTSQNSVNPVLHIYMFSSFCKDPPNCFWFFVGKKTFIRISFLNTELDWFSF